MHNWNHSRAGVGIPARAPMWCETARHGGPSYQTALAAACMLKPVYLADWSPRRSAASCHAAYSRIMNMALQGLHCMTCTGLHTTASTHALHLVPMHAQWRQHRPAQCWCCCSRPGVCTTSHVEGGVHSPAGALDDRSPVPLGLEVATSIGAPRNGHTALGLEACILHLQACGRYVGCVGGRCCANLAARAGVPCLGIYRAPLAHGDMPEHAACHYVHAGIGSHKCG